MSDLIYPIVTRPRMLVPMHPLQEDVDLAPLDLVLQDALVVLLDVVAAIDALVVLEDLPVLVVAHPAALVLPVVVVDQTAVRDPLAQHNVAVLSALLIDVVREVKILQEMSKWILYKIYFTSNLCNKNKATYTHTHRYTHTNTTTHTHTQQPTTNNHNSILHAQTKTTASQSPPPENDVELYNFLPNKKRNMLSSKSPSHFLFFSVSILRVKCQLYIHSRTETHFLVVSTAL